MTDTDYFDRDHLDWLKRILQREFKLTVLDQAQLDNLKNVLEERLAEKEKQIRSGTLPDGRQVTVDEDGLSRIVGSVLLNETYIGLVRGVNMTLSMLAGTYGLKYNPIEERKIY